MILDKRRDGIEKGSSGRLFTSFWKTANYESKNSINKNWVPSPYFLKVTS